MNKYIRPIRRLLTSFFIFVVFFTPAAVLGSTQEEISHLLNYIKTSNCVFTRNNSSHSPEDAVQHIEKKYNYLKKRISSTEDFIKGTATKSSMSGMPYMIICEGVEMETADWLRIELKKYRSK